MFGRRALVLVAAATIAAAGCGKDNNPTGPSNTPTPPAQTRIIAVSGDLAFGQVEVGQSRDATFTIANTGNTALAVSGMTVSGGLSTHIVASWTSGSIAAGASQTVTVRFQPTAGGAFSGTVTINGDQTSGSNTLPISGTGVNNSITGTWNGNYTVERCDGTGSIQDIFCSTNRGVYPVGSTLPIRLVLTQNGTNVTGTVSFGQVQGPVNGNLTNGTLTLQGTATSGQISAQISNFSLRQQGSSLAGNITFNMTFSGVPGTAVVVTRASLTK